MTEWRRTKGNYKRKLLIASREAALAYDPKLGRVPDKLMAHKHKVPRRRVTHIRQSLGIGMERNDE